tara:strand:- start:30 stop:731 length:702 start_codon:yes stop_codon:yes gene_type:complete
MKENNSEKMSHDWAEIYRLNEKSGIELNFPSETLVRLFKGNYVKGKPLDYTGKSVLDVGFGNGNNTLFLASLGMHVSGIEMHIDICNQVKMKFEKLGLLADLRLGTNKQIPFENNSFDFLISWNVLHYEGNEEYVKAGIREYARVLNTGARIFLSTTGPEHKILTNSKTLGKHTYKIGRKEDFRSGQVHFLFDKPHYLKFYFEPYFEEIQIGRIQDGLFQEKLDWWLLTAKKR